MNLPEVTMITGIPNAREKHFREMAVWHDWPLDEERYDQPDRANVGPNERIVSALAGGGLMALGIARRSAPGWGLATLGAGLLFRGATGYCHAYRALGINNARQGSAEPEDYYRYGIQVTHSVTINSPPEKLFNYWRDFENLPRIMSHLESVEVIDELRSHWVAQGPFGSQIEWDAEIINEEPFELIAWKSLPDAEVDNAGSVRFVHAPGGRGTQVRVNIEYIPIAGKIGAAVAKMFGREPNQEVREDLRRFKQMMEAHEIPSVEGQPQGRCVPCKDGRTAQNGGQS
jgi:uncharacterized membrane protein